jgi:hypothetical protein
MILVDTNLISEPMKAAPDPAVLKWFARNSKDVLYFSAIGVAELMRGIAILPDGKRKTQMANDLELDLERVFQGRILPFDEEAARAYGVIHGKMRAAGRAIGILDSQIAAIALVRNLTIATRDVQPFIDAGVPVVNPWAEE